MNVDNEIITAGTPWYCPFTSVHKSILVGKKIPGVKKACEIALKAHREEVSEMCPSSFLAQFCQQR